MNCKRCDRPISEHEAGPETDACVAVVVMGWRPLEEGGPLVHPNTNLIYGYDKEDDLGEYVFNFSTSIFEAWKVIERANQDNAMNLRWYNPDGRTSIFSVSFGFGKKVIAEAETAPLAICRAALKCHPSNS